MAELSKEREHVDKQLLHTAATGFIKQIQVCVCVGGGGAWARDCTGGAACVKVCVCVAPCDDTVTNK
jgi:hypothetical protein